MQKRRKLGDTGFSGERTYTQPRLRGMAIGAKMNARFPYAQYGRSYSLRGSDASLAAFGATWRDANEEQRSNRTNAGFVGRGKYSLKKFGKSANKFSKGRIGRSLLGMGARAADPYTGGMASRALRLSGRGLYTGHGAYTNELISGGSMDVVPSFTSASDETGSVMISRKVYLGDIFGPASSGFNVQAYPINPGIEASFPWVSAIAANYEEYTLHQLIYTFRSTVSDVGSTTGQVGTVIMATNYNADAGPFTDKSQMMEYTGAVSAKSSLNLLHGVECDPRKLSGSEGKFVRSAPIAAGDDLKNYDHGLFQLAVSNCPTLYQNQQIGELWVSYTFEFRKPKQFTGRGFAITQDYYVSGAGTESITAPFGTRAGLLQAQQNSMNTFLCSTIDSKGNALTALGASNTTCIIFPSYYAGNVEVMVVLEGAQTASSSSGWAAWDIPLQNDTKSVRQVADLYAADSQTSDSPDNFLNSVPPIATSCRLISLAHFFISPAVNGFNNVVRLTNVISSAASQATILIREYNTISSYRNQNVGPIGNQSDAPILINQSGITVSP